MPWQLGGTFLRVVGVDPTYSATAAGELWGQDLTASIKIIASRHDYHDQDLALGIEECLNIDGLNSMRAGIQMSGNFISGLPDAFSVTDAAAYGQCAGSMTYVGTTLTLIDRNNVTIDTVEIIAGGGGSGTVTSITNDGNDTIVCTPDPIVASGTIGMKALDNPGQSYSNNINGIVIDDYGRVTQVTTGTTGGGGGDPDQTISLNRTGSTYDISLSQQSGSNTVTILAASATGAGLMSNGSQTIAGIKTFSATEIDIQGQLFVGGGLTTDQEVRMENLPTSLGATTQIGDLYIDGDIIKIRIV